MDAPAAARKRGAFADFQRVEEEEVDGPQPPKYVGDWVDDVECGLGKLTATDGETYEGEWDAGVRHGRGIAHYPDGTCYVGEWLDGVKQGAGHEANPPLRSPVKAS